MGCDIHLAVEVRDAKGKWRSADKWIEEDGYFSNYPSQYYEGRSYGTYAILADVRNYHNHRPISQPRGVPRVGSEEASPEYLRWVNQWGVDGHSHSYFTVAELLAFDWSMVATYEGIVTLKEWAHYKVFKKPENWCMGTSGKIVSIDDVEAEYAAMRVEDPQIDIWDIYHNRNDRLHQLEERLDATGDPRTSGIFSRIYTTIRWKVPYYDTASAFLSQCLPQLWRLGKPQDVRILFFFDN